MALPSSEYERVLNPENGGKKFKFFSFAQRVATLNINPVYRSDFLEEVIGQTTPNNNTRNDSSIFVEAHVTGGSVLRVDRDGSSLSSSSATLSDLESRIYQQLRTTYFNVALDYWKEKVATPDFAVLARELSKRSESLPHILLNLRDVVEMLMDVIGSQDAVTSHEAAYHLLAILAKDVGEDFCHYLPSILPRLIKALNPQDVNSLEHTFYTLASFFRYLSRAITRDLGRYLVLYQPWLIHTCVHVRFFAAESLSLLLRKMPLEQLPESINLVLDVFLGQRNADCDEDDASSEDSSVTSDAESILDNSTEAVDLEGVAEALGSLLFEVVKNVQNTFNSKLTAVATVLLDRIRKETYCSNQTVFQWHKTVVQVFFMRARAHTSDFDSRPCKSVEFLLISFLEDALSLLTHDGSFEEHVPQICCFAVELCQQWIVTSPRPSGFPTTMLNTLTAQLTKLLKFLREDPYNKASTVIWPLCIFSLASIVSAEWSRVRYQLFSVEDGPGHFLLRTLRDIVVLCPDWPEIYFDQLLRLPAAVLQVTKDQTDLQDWERLMVSAIAKLLLQILVLHLEEDTWALALPLFALTLNRDNITLEEGDLAGFLPVLVERASALFSRALCCGALENVALVRYLSCLNHILDKHRHKVKEATENSSDWTSLQRLATQYFEFCQTSVHERLKTLQQDHEDSPSSHLSTTAFELLSHSCRLLFVLSPTMVPSADILTAMSELWDTLLALAEPSVDALFRVPRDALCEYDVWISIITSLLYQLYASVEHATYPAGSFLENSVRCLGQPRRETRLTVLQLLQLFQLPAHVYGRNVRMSLQKLDAVCTCSLDFREQEVGGTNTHETVLEPSLITAVFDTATSLEQLPSTLENEKEKRRLTTTLGNLATKVATESGSVVLGIIASQILVSQLWDKFTPLRGAALEVLKNVIALSPSIPAIRSPSFTDGATSGMEQFNTSAQPDRKKRRIGFQLSPSAFQLWLLWSLQNACILSVIELATAPAAEAAPTRPSKLYTKRKRRGIVAERYCGTASQTAVADYDTFWKKTRTLREDLTTSRQLHVDPHTRHADVSKVLAELVKTLKVSTVFTTKDDQLCCIVRRMFCWILANTAVLCENADVALPSVESPELQKMQRLLAMIRVGRGPRVSDGLRIVLALGHVGHVETPTENVVLWQALVDLCLHRLTLLPDRALQGLALKVCLNSTYHGALEPYKTQVTGIIEETDLRNNLLLLAFDSIALAHRPVLIPLLVRILFSKLSKKSTLGAGTHTHMASRRRAIFRYLTDLPQENLPVLIAIVCRACFAVVHDTTTHVASEAQKETFLSQFLTAVTQGDSWAWELQNNVAEWKWNGYNFVISGDVLVPRINAFSALLTSLDDMCVQMRQTIQPICPFLGQLLASLVCLLEKTAHPHVEDSSETPSFWPVPRLRRLARQSLTLLGQLIVHHPVPDDACWNTCLQKSQETLCAMLKHSLQGDALSAPLKFLCQFGDMQATFPLLQSALSPAVPIMFDMLTSQRVFANIADGKPPGAGVDAVMTFILRLCRGGYDDVAHATKEWRLYHSEKNGTSLAALTDSVTDGPKAPSAPRREGHDRDDTCDYETWKATLQRFQADGQAVLRPHVPKILTGLYAMIERRRQLAGTQKGRHRPFSATLKELDVITELAKLVDEESETIHVLVRLLLLTLPTSLSAATTEQSAARLRLTLTALQQLSVHLSSQSSASDSVITDVVSKVTPLVQTVEDLPARFDVAKLLLCCELARLGVQDPLSVIATIVKTCDVPTEPFVAAWLPSVLKRTAPWVPTDTPIERLWPVTLAVLLTALCALRPRVATPEPHSDLHVIILAEIVGSHLQPLKGRAVFPASCQLMLLFHALFLLRTPTSDVSVRDLALRVICASTIERIEQLVTLRQKLAETTKLAPPQEDTSQGVVDRTECEWRECALLYRMLYFHIMTAVRFFLKSHSPGTFRAGLEILSQSVRRLSPIKEYLPSHAMSTGGTFFQEDTSTPTTMGADNTERLHTDLAPLLRLHCDGKPHVQWRRRRPSVEAPLQTRDDGGSLFSELLHIQRHRRARGVAMLTQAVREGHLCRTTVRHVVLPIGLEAVFQPESTSSSFHMGLAEKGSQCLVAIAQYDQLPWSALMTIVRSLDEAIRQTSSRDTFLVATLCKVIVAYFDVPSRVSVSPTSLSIVPGREAKDTDLDDDDDDDDGLESTASQTPQPCGVSEGTDTKASRSRRETPQQIKLQLLPILRRLAVMKNNGPTRRGASTVALEAKGSRHTREDQVTYVRPPVVAAQLHVLKRLPADMFQAELPKLLHLLTSCLASRDREARRKARGALCSAAVTLGPDFLPQILQTLSTSLTKGYQRSVLGFTATALATQLVFGSQGKGALAGDVRIPYGSIDSAIPLFLPLIEEELERLCDPDRPEYEEGGGGGVLTRRPGVDEARHFVSGDLLFTLSRIASFNNIVLHRGILKFLHGLLSGGSCTSRTAGSSAATAFNKKYRHIVQTLFDQCVAGLSKNASIKTSEKLTLTFRLFELHHLVKAGYQTPSRKRLASKKLAAEEDAFFVTFLSQDTSSNVDASSHAEPSQNAWANAHEERMKKFLIQPGAATGRSVEQVVHRSHGVDLESRAMILALASLRLTAALLKELRHDPRSHHWIHERSRIEAHTPDTCRDADGVTPEDFRQLLVATSQHVIDLFCSSTDTVFQWAARCLLGLLGFHLPTIKKEGKRIAVTVLNVSKATADKTRGAAALCTRLLALLLTNFEGQSWFNALMNAQSPDAVKKGSLQQRTFKTALLAHILATLDDPHLRGAAVHLFRRVILLRERNQNLEVAEHAALVYQCADEIGTLALHATTDTKLASVCSGIYVDFLMSYPMDLKAQQKRIAFVIKNLNYPVCEGRRAMLGILYELSERLPPDLFIARYSSVFLLSLTLRLVKEDDATTRRMTRAFISHVLSLFPEENQRVDHVQLVIQGFLGVDLAQRLSLVEFLELLVDFYDSQQRKQRNANFFGKLPMILTPLSQSLVFSTNASVTLGPACDGFCVTPVPEVPLSDTKLLYHMCRCVEKILAGIGWPTTAARFQQTLHPYLYDDQRERPRLTTDTSITPLLDLIALWRLIVLRCRVDHDVMIQAVALRCITTALSGTASRLSPILFSERVLPELTSLPNKKAGGAVLPLTRLLVDLIEFSRQPNYEECGSIGSPLVATVIAISKSLLCCTEFPSKQSHVVASLDEDIKDGFECSGASTPSLHQHPVSPQGQQLTTVHTGTASKDDAVAMTDVNVETPPHAQQPDDRRDDVVDPRRSNRSDEDEEEEDSGDAPNQGGNSNDDSLSDFGDNDPDDQLFNEAIDSNLANPLLTAAITAEETEPNAEVSDLETEPHANMQPDVLQHTLKHSGISWMIGRLSWSIRRSLGDIASNVIRLATALEMLKELCSVLPAEIFQQQENLVRRFVEALYPCASLTGGTAATTTSFSALCLRSTTSMEPVHAIATIQTLGAEALATLQRILIAHNLEASYTTAVKTVRLTIGKRRQQRKLAAKIIKVRDPKRAAWRKAQKHTRFKLARKRKLHRFRTQHGTV